MPLIADLIPLNLLEEKERFFQDPTYNPQFIYRRDFSRPELEKYGYPKESYVAHAKRMLSIHGSDFGLETPELSHQQISQRVLGLCEKLSIQPLNVRFLENQSGRIILSKNALSFRLPVMLNQEQMTNILNHEVQTHYLRRINDVSQGLETPIEKSPAFRRTEEGLANLHSFVESEDKIIRKTYVNYLAAHLSQNLSFSDLFHQLNQFELTPLMAWGITLQQKRGLKDTSQPGGFTKGVVYFEGIVEVWNWIKNPENNPKDLYLGRISLEEVAETKLKTDPNKSIYPTFFENMDIYRQNIITIGKHNEFEDLLD